MAVSQVIDAVEHFHPASADLSNRSVSKVARGMVGSEILRIASNVRALKAQGREVSNFTIGDFAPSQFPIPDALHDAVVEAYDSGCTNYPPSEGVLALRQAVLKLYETQLGLRYPVVTVQIISGARPGLYAAFAMILDPGETVIYPVPTWNNNHYAYLVGAKAVELPTRVEDGFLPTAELLKPHIKDARLISMNSPLNPSGTMISPEELRRICELIIAENERRKQTGERLLYLLYDQIYWQLQLSDIPHVTPVGVMPEMAAYTIFVDGISKSWAATGLRVGWIIAPPHVTERIRAFINHLGAWAPHPEQQATANVIHADGILDEYNTNMHHEARARLQLMYDAIQQMKSEGLPTDAIAPQGAIYLSTRFDLIGKKLDGALISTNAQIGDILLEQAGVAVVPFQAFGLMEENGWMRLSIGAVSIADIEQCLPRLRAILERVEA